MKLNTKRTVLVGFAFFSICAFWQMYDNVVPLILSNTFRLNETLSGAIMAADNVLALFLLPLFGGLSDRINTKIGRRMPFILGGTILAVGLMNILPHLAGGYYSSPSNALLIGFVVVLGMLLISMGTYRSPAVALMPDVTPKPLRSKGNAIINLMGALGSLIYLGIAAVLYSDGNIEKFFTLGSFVDAEGATVAVVDYGVLFAVVSAIMAAAVAVLFLTVKEPKLSAENKAYEQAHPEENLAQVTAEGTEQLPKEVKRSLIFVLISISLWFIGYNGVTTWFTTYISRVMGEGLGGASTCLLVANGGAIVSYIPIGALASKIGRKKTIMGGVILLASCFLLGFVTTINAKSITVPMYILFALVGLAWAAINVNSLPMVVEMCTGSEVGKFTGYYYTFSMAAQVVTPILAGTLLRNVGYWTLFPYAALFVAASFVTMLQVKHGDNKVEAKKGLEAFDVED
ncbi:MAG: MFS transporter [Oscillospiraceae bacterium]|nr:MFS transporter [Oscillospiraceae bacterium]